MITISSRRFILLTACGAALGLGACQSMYPPFQVPTGYVHHDNDYKSPLPPKSRSVSKMERMAMGPEQAGQLRQAVYGLLKNLTDRAGLPPKPVFVVPAEPMTALSGQLDNDLREAMRHLGYVLAPTPNGAYIFKLEATPAGDGTMSEGAPNVMLTMRVFESMAEEARQLTEESGTYFVKGAEHSLAKPKLSTGLGMSHMPNEEPRVVNQ